MSRIGRAPITVPSDVQVQIENHHVKVKGPLGELSRDIHPDITVELQADQILVEPPEHVVIGAGVGFVGLDAGTRRHITGDQRQRRGVGRIPL